MESHLQYHLQSLPMDILRHLASFLDLISLCDFFRTCRRINSIKGSDSFWQEKIQTDFPSSTTSITSNNYQEAYYTLWLIEWNKKVSISELRKNDLVYQEALRIYNEKEAYFLKLEKILNRRYNALESKVLRFNFKPTYHRISHRNPSTFLHIFNRVDPDEEFRLLECVVNQPLYHGSLIHLIPLTTDQVELYFLVYKENPLSEFLEVSSGGNSLPAVLKRIAENEKWSSEDLRKMYNLPFEVTPEMLEFR